ncbi:hypothetical protein MK079_01290 [Candidatus Gracilibacteria bacterium]|nr:hypothetical protein [Candidatus Gracilibacteria bacterium]
MHNIASISQLKTYIQNSDTYPQIQLLIQKLEYQSGGYTLPFLNTEYSKTDIKKFYQTHKKLSFKKPEKQLQEIKQSWSEATCIQLIESILIYSLDYNIEIILEKINHILSDLCFTTNIEEFKEHLEKTVSQHADEMDIDFAKELQKTHLKDFFYKYIFPKSLLNDEKGQYYSSEEREYIADLRWTTQQIPELLQELREKKTKNVRTLSIEEIRKDRKRSLEINFMILFLFPEAISGQIFGLNPKDPTKTPQELRELLASKVDISCEELKKIFLAESGLLADKEYASFSRILYEMVYHQSLVEVEYHPPSVSLFYYAQYIIPCLQLLGELLENKK